VIPNLTDGLLPPGRHPATSSVFAERFVDPFLPAGITVLNFRRLIGSVGAGRKRLSLYLGWQSRALNELTRLFHPIENRGVVVAHIMLRCE
jgi:hypothetical protein